MNMLPKPTCQIIRLCHHDPALLESLGKLRDELMAYHGNRSSSARFMTFITNRLKDESMLLLLALAAETPIGYALAFDVAEHPFMPEWERSGYIAQFFVKPEYRHQGIGQLLFDRVMDWLAGRGIEQTLLNVSIQNEVGIRFWQKQGFESYANRMIRKEDSI